eukprot:TRINITY_DN3017_c0_g1_i1.p1 TRINITY_DN3017_c0_g1~~TRINITY_DN3017_c0_g1_i1.p1  ORF type:complete len:865 (-),score=179.82 TRINITY_DN3017_c0_g1_i1:184-2778(-)
MQSSTITQTRTTDLAAQAALQSVRQMLLQFGINSDLRDSNLLQYNLALSGMEFSVNVRVQAQGQVLFYVFRYRFPFTIHDSRILEASDFINRLNLKTPCGGFILNKRDGEVLFRVSVPDLSTSPTQTIENLKTSQTAAYRSILANREVLRPFSVPVQPPHLENSIYAYLSPNNKVAFQSNSDIETYLKVVPGDRFTLASQGIVTYIGCYDRKPYIIPDRDLFARSWSEDQKPLEFLRKFGRAPATRKYLCRDGSQREFDVSHIATHPFNFLANDRVAKDQNFGLVIGVLNKQLWVHYDQSSGAEPEPDAASLSLVARYGYPATSVVKVADQYAQIDVSSLSTAEHRFAPGDYVMTPNQAKAMLLGLCDDRLILHVQGKAEPGAWRIIQQKDLSSLGFVLIRRPCGSGDVMTITPIGQMKFEVGAELFQMYGFSAGDSVTTPNGVGIVLGSSNQDLYFSVNRIPQCFKGYRITDFRSRGFSYSGSSNFFTTHESSRKIGSTPMISMIGPFLNRPQPLPVPPEVRDNSPRNGRPSPREEANIVDVETNQGIKAPIPIEPPSTEENAMQKQLLEELLQVDGSQPGGLAMTNTFAEQLKKDDYLLSSSEVSVDMGENGPIVLGKGAFGVVYSGTLWQIEEVAIKRIRLRTKRQYEDVKAEFRILSSLNHPNVVRVYGVCSHNSELFLVMDKCPGGTLEDYFRVNTHLTWKQKLNYAVDVGKGLNFLHRRGIIHRDIKLSNMLIRGSVALLADFGLSRSTEYAEAGEGTPLYMAPELTKKGQRGTHKVDVYAFGIALWYMDRPDENPYPGVTTAPDLFRRVQSGQRPVLTSFPEQIATSIRECWDGIPERRPEMPEVVLTLRRIIKGLA